MTRTIRSLKGLLAVLVALATAMALSISVFAEASDTVTETVVVTQIITDGTAPSKTSYTYVLTPKQAENPMPDGTKDGKYVVGLISGETTDANAPTFTLEIDKTKPGVYEYILEKVESTPKGDVFSPDSHIFGYKVEVDEATGELVVIPYICQSGSPIFSEPDENGYPTKLTLPNTITGPATTTSTTKATPTSRTVTTAKGGTTARAGTTAKAGTASRARWVNTGDESQLLTWVIILGIALAALIVIIFLRRRNDDEEDV